MKVLAYCHSKQIDGKHIKKEEVEIVDQKTENGMTSYTVKTKDGIKCTAIYNVFSGAYYADDVHGIIAEIELDSKKQLSVNAEANYDRFALGELESTKEEIFANSYKINFYSTMYDYFTGDNGLDKDTCQFLCKDNDMVLDNLYKDFLDSETASINSWEDIDDFIINEYSCHCSNSTIAM